ncbi:hypothetical protein QC763_0003990 [Podospora pseudopauciseta]|uniref:Uncharacterized protein n=2 Tax=Podospora TaxID=5144 RepID=A0ABR0HWY5_9PEZI|nr:hypothetical protein QC763_0003990 [Podospora pseudopauciseta]KAK4680947.1 hypothetical protein QC764_0004000 [Podospora pseudoanserina]
MDCDRFDFRPQLPSMYSHIVRFCFVHLALCESPARLPCAAQALACFIWADLRQEPSGVSLTPPHGVGTARGSALSRKVPQLRE